MLSSAMSDINSYRAGPAEAGAAGSQFSLRRIPAERMADPAEWEVTCALPRYNLFDS